MPQNWTFDVDNSITSVIHMLIIITSQHAVPVVSLNLFMRLSVWGYMYSKPCSYPSFDGQ